MALLDVLLSEHLVGIFLAAEHRGDGDNAVLLAESPEGVEDMLGGRGAAVRVEMRTGGSLLVTPRRIAREVGSGIEDIVLFPELVGYDWISPDLSEKVRLKDHHYDRLYLYLADARTVTLEGLGPAVYPLMKYLGKVLELRSRKVLLRRLDKGVVDLVSRCLGAAAQGPFFEDDELDTLFALDRAGLQILAATWSRMNLAAPDLRRTVVSVMEMLLERRPRFVEAWAELVASEPDEARVALEGFRTAMGGRALGE
jgi:hypothetical protein